MQYSSSMKPILLFLSLSTALFADDSGRFDLSERASKIDFRAKAHPEIGFLLEKDGKPQDVQHSTVDTRVPSQGKLVIWLMGYNKDLFDHLASYGLHAIQPHYANGWFGKLYSGPPPSDELFLSNIRLEAATGEDSSRAVEIPKPDSIMERSYQFVKWLDRKNPQGQWKQFLTRDGRSLQWEKVILTGSSHGSTTAARMAKAVKVDRVVMFSGPRDQFDRWQSLPSATPENRFFGFTHILDDGWGGDHYPRSWQMLNLQKFGPIVNVDRATPPFGDTRRLITDGEVKNDPKRAHNCVVPGGNAIKGPDGKYAHELVWRYLFTHPVEQTGQPVPADPKVWMDQRKPRP